MSELEQIGRSSGIRHYRPELDVVRFIAFFAVFLHHGLPRTGFLDWTGEWIAVSAWRAAVADAGGFGLCLFFVLSAYLIADLLLRERDRTGTVALGRFFARRIRRIWPLYIVGLLLGTAWGLALHQPTHLRFAAYFLLLGNWYCVTHGWGLNPFTPLWSISIEEQFYLLWPGIAKYAGRGAMFAVCAALLAAANATLLHLGRQHANLDVAVWANSVVQLQMFAAGILLALVLRQRIPQLAAGWRAVLVLACPGCWYVAAHGFHIKPQMGNAADGGQLVAGYGLVTLGCVALLVGLLGISSRLVPAWLAYLGRISYGLYVFHLVGDRLALAMLRQLPLPWAARTALEMAAALGITVAIAAASYRWLERPLLRLRD